MAMGIGWEPWRGTCFWPGQKQESHRQSLCLSIRWLAGRLLQLLAVAVALPVADLHASQLKSLLFSLCIYPALKKRGGLGRKNNSLGRGLKKDP